MFKSSSLERSADSLAELILACTSNNDGALRLDLLRWVLALPLEIDPALPARILIARQARGEGPAFPDVARAMIAELGRFDRACLAAIPRRRRPRTARTGPNPSLACQVGALAAD
jgi:hypothetical protein